MLTSSTMDLFIFFSQLNFYVFESFVFRCMHIYNLFLNNCLLYVYELLLFISGNIFCFEFSFIWYNYTSFLVLSVCLIYLFPILFFNPFVSLYLKYILLIHNISLEFCLSLVSVVGRTVVPQRYSPLNLQNPWIYSFTL